MAELSSNISFIPLMGRELLPLEDEALAGIFILTLGLEVGSKCEMTYPKQLCYTWIHCLESSDLHSFPHLDVSKAQGYYVLNSVINLDDATHQLLTAGSQSTLEVKPQGNFCGNI